MGVSQCCIHGYAASAIAGRADLQNRAERRHERHGWWALATETALSIEIAPLRCRHSELPHVARCPVTAVSMYAECRQRVVRRVRAARRVSQHSPLSHTASLGMLCSAWTLTVVCTGFRP